MRFDGTPLFVRAGYITVTSQQTRMDGKNTITDTFVEHIAQCPPTPAFDLYTLEDELKSRVKLQQVATKVLTQERPDANFFYRPSVVSQPAEPQLVEPQPAEPQPTE